MAASAAAPRPDRLAALDWLIGDEESARTWALFWRCCRRLAPVLRQSRTGLTSLRRIALLRSRYRIVFRRAIWIDLRLHLRRRRSTRAVRLFHRRDGIIHRFSGRRTGQERPRFRSGRTDHGPDRAGARRICGQFRRNSHHDALSRRRALHRQIACNPRRKGQGRQHQGDSEHTEGVQERQGRPELTESVSSVTPTRATLEILG
jgi:hypothetical protein